MKHPRISGPLPPWKRGEKPFAPEEAFGRRPPWLVIRTERRSWFTLAITGFGALLLRYLRTLRERTQTRPASRTEPRTRPGKGWPKGGAR